MRTEKKWRRDYRNQMYKVGLSKSEVRDCLRRWRKIGPRSEMNAPKVSLTLKLNENSYFD